MPGVAGVAAGGCRSCWRAAPEAALRLARAHPGAQGADRWRRRWPPGCAPRWAPRPGGASARSRSSTDAVEAEFDLLAGPEVPLPGGGRLLVHPTPALTALDVDAGARGRRRDPVAQRAAERGGAGRGGAADPAAPPGRADPARPRRADAEAPRRADRAADRARWRRTSWLRLLGLGPLGLVEIVRPRIHPPLHEVLAGPLTPGLAALRRAAREAAAGPARRLALRAPPAVLAALEGLPGALADAAAAAASPSLARTRPCAGAIG